MKVEIASTSSRKWKEINHLNRLMIRYDLNPAESYTIRAIMGAGQYLFAIPEGSTAVQISAYGKAIRWIDRREYMDADIRWIRAVNTRYIKGTDVRLAMNEEGRIVVRGAKDRKTRAEFCLDDERLLTWGRKAGLAKMNRTWRFEDYYNEYMPL